MALESKHGVFDRRIVSPRQAHRAAFCSEHSDLRFEINAEGELLVMAPANSKTGARNAWINLQLGAWAEQDGRGFVFDSSSGFVLPNGALLSPDAAWIPHPRLDAIDPASQDQFPRLCPDFVIELKSPSDRLAEVREKMNEWIGNGARLGWLIDPETRSVEIYRPGRAPEILVDPPSVAGEDPVNPKSWARLIERMRSIVDAA